MEMEASEDYSASKFSSNLNCQLTTNETNAVFPVLWDDASHCIGSWNNTYGLI